MLIAVKSTLYSSLISLNNINHEELFILVKNSTTTYILGCTYITDSPSIVYSQHAARIEEIFLRYLDAKFIIAGDYNLRHVLWPSSNNQPLNYSGYVPPDSLISADCIFKISSLINIKQIFPIHPHKGYTLDLCFCYSNYFSIIASDRNINLVKIDEHHIPVLFKLELFFEFKSYK